IGPTQVLEPLSKRRGDALIHRIVFVAPNEHADASHAVGLLRPRHHRPRRGAPDPSDEVPPSHLSSPRLIGVEPIAGPVAMELGHRPRPRGLAPLPPCLPLAKFSRAQEARW